MKDGKSIYLTDLRELGYLPEAVVNWIALMGWSYDDHTEFFTMTDLIEKFSLDRLKPSPAAINFSKLDHFNGLHIRNLEIADLAQRIKPFFEAAGYRVDDEKLLAIAPIIQERMTTLEEGVEIAGFFFKEQVHPEPDTLIGKKMSAAESAQALRSSYHLLDDYAEIKPEVIEQPMRDLADALGLKAGQLFGLLRNAVTAQRVSPPLFETMAIIGKETVLKRLKRAAETLEGMDKSGQFDGFSMKMVQYAP